MKVNYKPILIIRTVSIEKLGQVIELCVSEWKQNPIYILTSPERQEECLQDPRVSVALPYMISESFDEKYDSKLNFKAVVFPLENKSGIGYSNVFDSFMDLNTEGFYLSSTCLSMKKISHWRLVLKIKYEKFFHSIAKPLASFFGNLVVSSIHRVWLKDIKKRKDNAAGNKSSKKTAYIKHR